MLAADNGTSKGTAVVVDNALNVPIWIYMIGAILGILGLIKGIQMIRTPDKPTHLNNGGDKPCETIRDFEDKDNAILTTPTKETKESTSTNVEVQKKLGFRERKAEYEKIVVGDGKNIHSFETWPLAEKKYEDSRFLKRRSIADRFKRRLRFLVVMKGNPLVPVTLKDKVTVSSRLLHTVESSRTLKSALSDLFRKPFSFGFGGRKMLFIIIIIGVGVVAYLVMTGQINLGSFKL
jgi:hypothetical protein